jgi:hypothetical protein
MIVDGERRRDGRTAMLAEKFLLLLETLRSNIHDDGAPRIISTSPHIAIDLASAGSNQVRRAAARGTAESAGR